MGSAHSSPAFGDHGCSQEWLQYSADVTWDRGIGKNFVIKVP